MSPTTQDSRSEVSIRPLAPSDLDAVVALDATTSGAARRAYFERRRAASIRHPEQHLELAAVIDERLVGLMLARTAGGEYGRPAPVIVLETVGVQPGLQRGGVGRRLLGRLDELARLRGAQAIVTQVDWRNAAMLRFLDGAGFSIARRHVLDRDLSPLPEAEGDDQEHPAIRCRALAPRDLEAVIRIDAAITGTPRADYLARKVGEALDESAIAVSLVAESDGFVVGFATARVDAGDYGRLGSVASLDTIGVSPRFAGQGFGHALLAQLLQNLAGLRVERIETEAARDAFALLSFLYRAGFEPSPKIPFERRVAR